MSVGMCLLALLAEEPSYGLRLKQEFESRTGGVWPLNAGQVYTTLDRLERDGLVRLDEAATSESQKVHEITDAGRSMLRQWFDEPTQIGQPARDTLVLKLVMAVESGHADVPDVIQAERRGAIGQLQEYTRLKRGADPGELGWAFLLDSLIFQGEARVRWLDACEARLRKVGPQRVLTAKRVAPSEAVEDEVAEVPR